VARHAHHFRGTGNPGVIIGAKGAGVPPTPCAMGHAYRVKFRSRNIPTCYLKWRILEFTHTKRIIWVRTRKQRDELLCCDRSATWSSHLYRQCKRCGRKTLGLAAQIIMADEKLARMKGEGPPSCGKWCIDE